MGLELRHGTTRYYRKERRGRRVVSRYVASGPRAELLAAQDVVRRAKARRQRSRRRLDRAEERLAELELVCYGQSVDEVVRAYLQAVGYHRPNRGPWRRRRGAPKAADPAPAPGSLGERLLLMNFGAIEGLMFDGEDEGGAGAERAEAMGASFDAATRARWPRLIAVGLATGAGVRVGIARAMTDETDREARAALMAEAEAIRDEAANDDPTPLERLLAERIAACWLDVRRCAHPRERDTLTRDDDRRVRRAEKRLMHAAQTLAEVRRLLRPTASAPCREPCSRPSRPIPDAA